MHLDADSLLVEAGDSYALAVKRLHAALCRAVAEDYDSQWIIGRYG
jgi:hypothetical protein